MARKKKAPAIQAALDEAAAKIDQARAEDFAKIDDQIWGPVPPLRPLQPGEPAGIGQWLTPDVPPQDLPTETSEAKGMEGDGRDAVSHVAHKQGNNATLKDLQDADAIDKQRAGDTIPTCALPEAADENLPREAWVDANRRWRREGRSQEVAAFRDVAREEYVKAHPGCKRREAHDWSWEAAIKSFPPGESLPPPIMPISPAELGLTPAEAEAIGGLGMIPEAWPALTDNSSLQAELGWVQANRLLVVEEKGNTVIVHLERATTPAPSMAALGWLETSIRSYAKYIDIVSRVLTGAQDEAETTRRERMRLDEIQALLDEVHKGD